MMFNRNIRKLAVVSASALACLGAGACSASEQSVTQSTPTSNRVSGEIPVDDPDLSEMGSMHTDLAQEMSERLGKRIVALPYGKDLNDSARFCEQIGGETSFGDDGFTPPLWTGQNWCMDKDEFLHSWQMFMQTGEDANNLSDEDMNRLNGDICRYFKGNNGLVIKIGTVDGDTVYGCQLTDSAIETTKPNVNA
jgi:hypothetical protein